MNLRRYLQYTVRILFRSRSLFLLLPLLFSCALWAFVTIGVPPSRYFTKQGPLHLGDILFCIMSGQIDFAAAVDPHNIPFNIFYTLSFFILLFFPLNYFYKQLYGVGTQVLLRLGKRSYWWFGNLFIAFLMALIYCLLVGIGAVVVAWFKGWEMSLNLNGEFLDYLFRIHYTNNLKPLTAIPPLYFPVYPLVVIGIFIWQGIIEILNKPIYGYLIMFVYVYATNYLFNPLFFVNSAMLLRTDCFYEYGSTPLIVYLVACIWVLLGSVVGFYVIKKIDILEKDHRS